MNNPILKILIEKPWNYTATLDEIKNITLIVLCGTVAMFEKSITLTSEQKAIFDTQGETYLESLGDGCSRNMNAAAKITMAINTRTPKGAKNG